MTIYFLYILCGALSGFFSGLLGIGGGLVVVPLLTAIFGQSLGDSNPHIMHIVVATSLMASIFTAMSSAKSHTKKNAVRWDIVKKMALFIVIGTFTGVFLASFISSELLGAIIVIFLFIVATQILFDLYPKSTEKVFSNFFYKFIGLLLGFISSLVGLAGGSLFVPFLRYTGMDMHVAVGTSSGLAWFLAFSGGVGYAISGFGMEHLPAFSIGYVNIPAMLGIAIPSIFIAPLGVRASHALPVDTLRKVFACFLYISATRMYFSIF